MRVLVTGSAGFIGFHIARRLVADGHLVVGFDGMTPYYDVRLKERRHAILAKSNGFRARIGQLEDKAALEEAVADCRPDVIIHLAAQAGVRYSLEHPEAYVSANLDGMFNLLEVARSCAAAPADRLDQLGLWRQRQDAVPRDRPGRLADDALRRDQEGRRGDVAFLCPSLEAADDLLPLLHRLWALGTARHGADQVRLGDRRRPPDRGLWRRPYAARFHLHRRSRRSGDPADRRRAGSGQAGMAGVSRIRCRRWRRGASSTSPAASPSGCCRSSRRSNAISASRRARSCCRCRRATSRRRSPTPRF